MLSLLNLMASLQALSTGFLSDMVEHFLLSFKLSYYIDIYECFLIVKKKKKVLFIIPSHLNLYFLNPLQSHFLSQKYSVLEYILADTFIIY